MHPSSPSAAHKVHDNRDAMDDLEDELDSRYYRGLDPDVYYRAPSTESLDVALRSELERNASSLIPSDIVTDFVFGPASTITIPVTQQADLEELIEPQDYAQSIQVEYALCRDLVGKDRLKIQRAVSKSIVAAIQEADGFKYSERKAYNAKSGGDGVRLRYVCQDSLENKDRKTNKNRKEKDAENEESIAKASRDLLPTYDCGGAIYIKFSLKREAINVVYKHNTIHRDVESRRTQHDDSAYLEANDDRTSRTMRTPKGTSKKRKQGKEDHPIAVDNEYHDPNHDMSNSPEGRKSSAKKRRSKSNGIVGATERTKKVATKKAKISTTTTAASSASKVQKQAMVGESSPSPRLARNKACIRCREKKIKCNEAKPNCNQCKRGLWTCQYQAEEGPKKHRSANGCMNCKQRRRKCTEEKPFCAYCLKMDDDCRYAEYS